jgi:hypothetical protein
LTFDSDICAFSGLGALDVSPLETSVFCFWVVLEDPRLIIINFYFSQCLGSSNIPAPRVVQHVFIKKKKKKKCASKTLKPQNELNPADYYTKLLNYAVT